MQRIDDDAPAIVIAVRLPPAMLRALDNLAAARRTSRSEILRDALAAAVPHEPIRRAA